jgi:hypothetical protein
MENILSFDEFVNEKYLQESTDADGFDPTHYMNDEDPLGSPLTSVDDLIPGKEYVLDIDGEIHTDMIYQGVTGNVYIFNGEDSAVDLQFTAMEIADLVSSKAVTQVLEGYNK